MTRLSRGTVAVFDAAVVDLLALPEKVVQFGTGAFLRGFIDYFIDEANRAGRFNGRIVAVSSTGSSRDAMLNDQDGLFTLAIQGIEAGEPVQHRYIVSSVSRALSARDEWDAVLAVARDPNIELVVSNTTEVGITLDESDDYAAAPPRSFPGKLTRFLVERARAFDFDPRRGVLVLPCELIEDNGSRLRDIVRTLARRWELGPAFDHWLTSSVVFCNTLVDRIVPGATSIDTLGYRDDLLTVCEPYALFAIEGDAALRTRLGFPGDDSRIVVTPDIQPYRDRKVRILNGGHSILVSAALLAGRATVRDAVDDERLGSFLRRAMFDEILPSLDVPDADAFAREVLDRFANPYVDHALIDIALYGTTKLRVRVVPSIIAYHARTGRAPASLAFGFAAYLAFMRGAIHDARRAAGLAVPQDADGDRVRAAWSSASVADAARSVCADVSLWGVDLTAVDGFADAVADHLIRIVGHGVETALDVHLTETVNS
jgi:tagaturonate reductase